VDDLVNGLGAQVGSEQWFVDETKAHGFTFVVVAVAASHVGRCRARMAKLPRRGQSALHFNKESNATKANAYRVIAAMPVTATMVMVPPGVRPVAARERAVRHVARRALEAEPQRIVFELDAAAVVNDRRWLSSELSRCPQIEYQHLGKNDDPMLWAADGIAWAVHRGGRWRSMIEHLIIATVEA
jgi:hypothetical protein